MYVLYAVSGTIAKPGSRGDLCAWAKQRIANRKAKIIKIVKARPGEPNASIVMEVTAEGITLTPNGRTVNLAALKRAAQDAG